MTHPSHLKHAPDGRLVLRSSAVRAYWTMFTNELHFTPEQTAAFLLDHALPSDIRAAQEHERTRAHE